MELRKFSTIDGKELVIKTTKNSIIFEYDVIDEKYRYKFIFNNETFKEILNYIEKRAITTWSNISPKEVTNLGNDYTEYYDMELDNEGYLIIGDNFLDIEKPSVENKRLYKFNKKKIETFIHDLRKWCSLWNI